MQVHCGTTQCGQLLGNVDFSVRTADRPRVVWYIQPGWHWVQGILQYGDETLRMERRLLHEAVGMQRPSEGMGLSREAELPICVRCPQCRRPRWIPPDILLRALADPARRSAVFA